jgi:hypothetical protein
MWCVHPSTFPLARHFAGLSHPPGRASEHAGDPCAETWLWCRCRAKVLPFLRQTIALGHPRLTVERVALPPTPFHLQRGLAALPSLAGPVSSTWCAIPKPSRVLRRTPALTLPGPQWIPWILCARPTPCEPHRGLHLAEPQPSLRISCG